MKRNFTDSINNAIDGIIYAFKTERNLKIHFAIALVLLLITLPLNLNKFELLMLFFAITLVLSMEMVNTAIEAMVNLLTLSHHPLAKIAKDVAAGGVLIAVFNSLIVAYLVFYRFYDKPIIKNVLLKMKDYAYHFLFLIFAVIIALVFFIKALGGKGRFTHGGIISGHAALAFSASTAILCLTKNIMASLLAFLIAVLVAQSRVEARIHHWLEVLLGALIGVGTSLAIFAFLSKIKF